MKITTAADRDQLPAGTVVRSTAGTIACRHTSGHGVVFGVAATFPWSILELPLTVLHHPDPALPSIERPHNGHGDLDRYAMVLVRRPDFWLVGCVFGPETPDSDMAYGHGATAEEALAEVLAEIGIAKPTPAADAISPAEVGRPRATGGPVRPQVCSSCGRERTLADLYDYHPAQVIAGDAPGWYEDDDYQLCGNCLAALLRSQP